MKLRKIIKIKKMWAHTSRKSTPAASWNNIRLVESFKMIQRAWKTKKKFISIPLIQLLSLWWLRKDESDQEIQWERQPSLFFRNLARIQISTETRRNRWRHLNAVGYVSTIFTINISWCFYESLTEIDCIVPKKQNDVGQKTK